MSEYVWVVMPVLNSPDLTEAALADLLAQSVPTKILIVNQGVDDPFRSRLERIAEEYPDRVYVWSHCPPLPSLSATWNRALRFVWEAGGTEALVCNNDIRCSPITVGSLKLNMQRVDALFVSAVGVTGEQYDKWRAEGDPLFAAETTSGVLANSKGGPDFSCYLISKEGHDKYPFDENFVPAFAEDLDMHRRYMLGGDGERIFSINLPFHHIGGGSQTLKSMDGDKRSAWEGRINAGSRAYYQRKWNGPVNHERLTIPFDMSTDQDGVDTPTLQHALQGS